MLFSTFAARMRVISLTEETRLTGSYAATIGFFDGVHLGHRYVLQQLCRLARERGLPSMAITFDRHPRQVVDTSWHPLLLTTLDEKIELLRQTDIDLLVMLPFDEQMACLSARDFMRLVLKERLGVSMLLTGYDNRFGHRTADSHEGFDDYVKYGREIGIDVFCGEGLQALRQQDDRTTRQQDDRTTRQQDDKTTRRQDNKTIGRQGNKTIREQMFISSSLIRRLLGEGRVDEAALFLGRPYSLNGTVVHGFQKGRTMGFPTANMSADECRLVPADGVYAVKVSLPPSTFPGITNIGMRPTFDGHQRTIETHILDFEGDLYGRDISIGFVARLRDEQHFESPEELAQQMARDAETAKQVLLDADL